MKAKKPDRKDLSGPVFSDCRLKLQLRIRIPEKFSLHF